jgi:GntR family galactonate operon transcriptional repressor
VVVATPSDKPSTLLHRRVVQELAARIVRGEVQPGQLLPPEPKLSEEFGVSRIVIREAMKVLSERGLVEIKQGRGTTVNPRDSWDPLDPTVLALRGDRDFYAAQAELMEARMIFEVQIAGLAATRASAQDLGEISAHLRRMDGMVGEPEAFHLADVQFHYLLVKASRNAVLARLLQPIHGILASGFLKTARLPGNPEQAQVKHWAIYRALEDRDPEGARRAMRAHLERAEQDLVTVGAWADPDLKAA